MFTSVVCAIVRSVDAGFLTLLVVVVVHDAALDAIWLRSDGLV